MFEAKVERLHRPQVIQYYHRRPREARLYLKLGNFLALSAALLSVDNERYDCQKVRCSVLEVAEQLTLYLRSVHDTVVQYVQS